MESAGPAQHYALETQMGRVAVSRTIVQRRDAVSGQVVWQGTENINVSAGEWMTEAMADELLRWLASNCRGKRPAWISQGDPEIVDWSSHSD